MTDGKKVPKYARAAAAVRALIADGTLRPGQAAPSGAALSRVTGYSTLTCRRALRVLIADGVLTPGPSRNARPRVAGPPQRRAERDLAAAARALSRGLAARRRANQLTQPELAASLGVSVTTIGHAETGRLWQSREFWQHADAVLGAGGTLLSLHDAYGEASAASATEPAAEPAGATGPAKPAGTSAGEPAGSAVREAAGSTARYTAGPQGDTAPADAAEPHDVPPWQPAPPGACPGTGPAGTGPRTTPAYVMIMWGDGTVTTVHPPDPPPAPGPAPVDDPDQEHAAQDDPGPPADR